MCVRHVSVGLEPWDILRSVSPMPSLKMLHADHVLQTHARSFVDLATEMCKQRSSCRAASASRGTVSVADILRWLNARSEEGANKVSPHEGKNVLSQTISLAAVARGTRYQQFVPQQPALIETLRNGFGCVPWNSFPVDLLASQSAGSSGSSSLTVCSNGTAVLPGIAVLLARAKRMLAAHAYLHWYERFECTAADLQESFECVSGIISDYASAVKETSGM